MLLRKCTILGRTMTSNTAVDKTAFHDGVARSADPGGLLHHLFGVRTLALMGQLKEEVSASYLSGLLIGHEVRAALPWVRTSFIWSVQRMLCGLYAQAIEACGGGANGGGRRCGGTRTGGYRQEAALDVRAWLERCPLVAILRGVQPAEAESICSALEQRGHLHR